MFDPQNDECAFVLKLFYQWYNDRTSEKSSYAEYAARKVNDATPSKAQDIKISYNTVLTNSDSSSSVYELKVRYDGAKDDAFINCAVVNDNIYLDFYQVIKDDAGTFYKALSATTAITVSESYYKDELISLYTDNNNNTFEIRYWISNMDFSEDKAYFENEGERYYVDKFIRCGGRVYTCTTGRSTKIRNFKKTDINKMNLVYDKDKVIAAVNKVYLTRVSTEGGKAFVLNAEENNKRKKDPPKPLFPVSDIDFHWKEISELEKYNPVTWNRRNIDLGK